MVVVLGDGDPADDDDDDDDGEMAMATRTKHARIMVTNSFPLLGVVWPARE